MSIRRWFAVLLAFGFTIPFLGCGGESQSDPARALRVAKKEMAPMQVAFSDNAPGQDADGKPAPADPGKEAPPDNQIKRKIKYTADLRLITDDFPKTEEALLALIDANQGFLSFADVATAPGQPRTGVWRARVPVEKFETFRRGVVKIGEIERNNVNTEDVTAQFYDLENHIKNKKAQEDALRELLKKTTDKMENLLAVQRELAGVRDAIERSEGQLRLLANLSDLTTVTIHVQERRKFEPEKPPESAEKPTFGSRVGKSFSESWQGVVDFAQSLTIGFVAITPWLPVILIAAAPFVVVYRRHAAETRRRIKELTAKTVEPTPTAATEPSTQSGLHSQPKDERG